MHTLKLTPETVDTPITSLRDRAMNDLWNHLVIILSTRSDRQNVI
jgi:hypothetical protein